ncbi:hypothetical protein D0864_15593 [Hortaea werneckii]|uniref:Uncharacterized protein n=1 Tax=Hortaea werneckii TaxID=91943 RepID=A0A3M7BXY7_HORWE|nr:hypothetical protein D0864_15593 [Hortaea werneckii]
MATRWNPCSYLPRRLQIVVSLTAFVLACILFLGTSSSDHTVDPYLDRVPYGPRLQAGAHHVVDTLPQIPHELPHLDTPQWLNPFREPAHTPPPEQANSSSGEARWYTDFKWRNPFSSAVTLDEERALLPPPRERPAVYTYVDSATRRKDDVSQRAEGELLHIWRRAWWAQGFKPVVLSRAEAMNNPHYRAVQTLELEPEMETEMMRWLAWGTMGTGILSNWLAVPMAEHEDALLTFLRRGEYPTLTRYEGSENGLFVGGKEEIQKAIKAAIDAPTIKSMKSIIDATPDGTFEIDSKHSGVAFYSASAIRSLYPAISQKLDDQDTVPEGLSMLPPLINSHLHMTWQNTFSSGIAVLKPLPEHTTSLIEPAIDIARNLSQCPETPVPSSCPPNRPRCKPCVSSHMPITTPPIFRNVSTLFTIATVPHPYTLTSLVHNQDVMDTRFIRRETKRDPWILAATKELLGTGRSSFARLVRVKEAIASETGSHRSLWLTAENPPTTNPSSSSSSSGETPALAEEDLDFHFGFQIPRDPMPDGKSETPVPGPERRPPPPKPEWGDGRELSPEELHHEHWLLAEARRRLSRSEQGKSGKGIAGLGIAAVRGGVGRKKEEVAQAKQVRDVVEAWNLADTETWKFVRAFEARRRVERARWEEEEEGFWGGAEGGRGRLGRWLDRVT